MPAQDSEEHGAGSQASGAAASILNEFRRLAEQEAGKLVQRAQEYGEQALTDGKGRAAAQLSAVGGAVRRAADKLHDQNNEALAQYVDSAAERVEQFAQQLEQRDVRALARDAEAIARRKPLLFLGGMFLAGVASAQLLKRLDLQVQIEPGEAVGEVPPEPSSTEEPG